ncbi:MAG: hypothetical protein VKJ86_03580 [Synechococcus sp.]|nr:hypothetical protein [Synechococcus sp.]
MKTVLTGFWLWLAFGMGLALGVDFPEAGVSPGEGNGSFYFVTATVPSFLTNHLRLWGDRHGKPKE